MDLQEFIEQVCRDRGINDAKFAKQVNLSYHTLWRSRKIPPSTKTIMACAAVAVSPEQRAALLKHYGIKTEGFHLPKKPISLPDAIQLYSQWTKLSPGRIAQSVDDTNSTYATKRGAKTPLRSSILKYTSIFGDVTPIMAFYGLTTPSGKTEHTLQECLKRARAAGSTLRALADSAACSVQRVSQLVYSTREVRLGAIQRFRSVTTDFNETLLAHGYLPPKNSKKSIDNPPAAK